MYWDCRVTLHLTCAHFVLKVSFHGLVDGKQLPKQFVCNLGARLNTGPCIPLSLTPFISIDYIQQGSQLCAAPCGQPASLFPHLASPALPRALLIAFSRS